MSIRNRLAALESRKAVSAISNSGAPDQLTRQLQNTAERMRDIPLDQLTAKASPVEVAALILDGRVDEKVARNCIELSKQSAPSANLFQCFLDAAGCTQASLAEEG
ncbi:MULTISPECIES: hypothetical protein [unclassified Ruegeria]|uniref:hypothetical protein n=1 Tax=unclassified Ruegeria TaxID=2625375 RepID=UPI001491250F|nr:MULTISPECIES: hypothetical protein [unclassified Ruegeria]NOD48718.1 hypothetical protein [Ruegeria sp. HKCCD5849]NOD51980.1 hypothetical protein [Ruegeria sp. HKCCD5851]NOD66638.1 hypothetical protein [Ruegeria sp. HKCCD7303]